MQTTTDYAPARLIVENIYQVRLPLPFTLNHVNTYLLRDDEGWTVLDSGLDTPECKAAWQAAFDQLGIRMQEIRQIVLTHMHPDHFGLAGFFQQESGAPVYLSPREAELAQQVWVDNAWTPQGIADYWRIGAIPPQVIEVIARQTERVRRYTMPHPHAITQLLPGALVRMGGHRFLAIHAPGHSDGQLVFYCAEEGLLLCGDQVLLKITPNIGLFPTTELDPLRRYLASLAELEQLEVALALPGHGRPISDWRGRIGELRLHHDERCRAMLAVAHNGGATAIDIARRVFDLDHLDDHDVRFAVAETMAHLEYLAEQGRMERLERPDQRLYRAL